ncbi:B-cell antigen receptor complex-associated protein alpha chain [Bombina bombina]|uniref:B-cell antigen receptor complex-associated protein alpha chain n=1 Tax=Bombina bombina TaxID=8345 RepID=UPI00235A82A9|nr:B-cell antigen receptor complex-associated protein alpha chain [Bombina bombina]
MQLVSGYPAWRPLSFILLLLSPGKFCWCLEMQWVLPSIKVHVGQSVDLECKFILKPGEEKIKQVNWLQMQFLKNWTMTRNITDSLAFLENRIKDPNHQILKIENTQKNDTSLYVCKVTSEGVDYKSCGTYLRVKEPAPYIFLKIAESTKNRLITAEGILLLLCTVIPGTLLLYKKRFENLRTASFKQSEGENLYEGLNLEECSMYEDISRGLQATYEDVATLRATDFQLEKP